MGGGRKTNARKGNSGEREGGKGRKACPRNEKKPKAIDCMCNHYEFNNKNYMNNAHTEQRTVQHAAVVLVAVAVAVAVAVPSAGRTGRVLHASQVNC